MNVEVPHMYYNNNTYSRRMLKKFVQQGRSESKGPTSVPSRGTLRISNDAENDAGGLFQHPAR